MRFLGYLWRSAGRRVGALKLRRAVEEHLDVLPVAKAQLRDTNRQMEAAVAQVGANFHAMVDRARDGVTQAARLAGSQGEGSGVGSLLTDSRSTLEGLLTSLVGDSHRCVTVVERLHALEESMARIVDALGEVDRISFGNTILALNAKIEAAHIGDRGKGFEVVAQELWLQARRSEEITATIRTTVLRLAEDAKGAAGEVRKLRCADPQEVSALQTQVQGALDQVDRTNRDMTDTLAAAADRSEELAREIAGAVTALQFQDRVSQQIGHVIQALESMEMAVVEPMRKGGDAISRVGAGDMRSAYTMEEERAVHAAALGQESAVETSGGDVELF